MLQTALSLITVITVYTATTPTAPLYCDRWDTELTFDTARAWIALPIEAYTTSRAQCGDRIRVTFADGYPSLELPALDAGPLSSYTVIQDDNTHARIVADLPMHLRPDESLSYQARIINLSALQRAHEERRIPCHP